MSAVLAALFSDHETAERVRTRLVSDGFPTDRVELTSCRELGQAGLSPAAPVSEKLLQYFREIFQDETARRSARLLARGVLEGHAAITVQPRGQVETKRAFDLLTEGGPLELREHDLDNQAMERAAAKGESPIVPQVARILSGQGPE